MKRLAFITGACGGIGSSLVSSLSDNGWNVIATDHPSFKSSSISQNSNISWVFQDLDLLVNNSTNQNKFLQNIIKASKGNLIQALIHNAAIQKLAPFQTLRDSDWIETFNVNFFSPVIISRLLLPQLIKNKGSIVHLTSIHAQLTKSNFSAYATSKAALRSLTKSMAVEMGDKLRVNAIEPAAIMTPLLEASFNKSDKNVLSHLSNYHPTGHIGQPEDICRAVLYLIDPKNTFLNGCILSLSGGIHGRLHDPG